MTFTLLELVALIAAVAVIVGVVAFVRMARQMTSTARELAYTARRITALTPSAQALLDHGEAGLQELKLLTRRTSEIAGDVQAVTSEASAATANFVRTLEGRFAPRASALVAGARAGLEVLRRVRGNGSETTDREAVLADR